MERKIVNIKKRNSKFIRLACYIIILSIVITTFPFSINVSASENRSGMDKEKKL